jgi:hypothetical protein
MKIKDIFKGAATAAIAFGASKLLPEPIAARSDPIKQITTDPETILSEWDYRLTQYARKAYIQKRIAASAKV